jgi:hypothetical protein
VTGIDDPETAAKRIVDERILPATQKMIDNNVAWSYESILRPAPDLAGKISQDRAFYAAQLEACSEAVEACDEALRILEAS